MGLLQWAVGMVALALLHRVASLIYSLYLGPLSKIPGSKLAAATYWYEIFYDVYRPGMYWEQVRDMHQKHGPVVRINPHEVHIDDPESYDIIYNNTGKWNKDARSARQFWAMGSIASTADHDVHKGRRSALNAYFARSKIDSLQPTILWHLDKMCMRIDQHKQQDRPIPLNLAFACLAADIVTNYLLPQPYFLLDTPDFSPSYYLMMRAGSKFSQVAKNFWWAYPVLENVPRWLGHILSSVGTQTLEDQDFVYDQIARFHANPDSYSVPSFRYMEGASDKGFGPVDKSPPNLPNGFLVEHILDHSLPGPASEKSYKRLAQEFQVLIGAGSDEVALVMSAILYYALDNPKILFKAKAELEKAGVTAQDLPNYRELERLPYLTAMINEGLRITIPIASRLTRVAPDRPLVFDQYIIPAGTTVSMSMMDIHLNPELFPDPHKYDPGRWLGPDASKNKKNLVAFSKGARNCVGMNLANAILPLTLAKMIARYDMKLHDTRIEDVRFKHDFFAPHAGLDTIGVQVAID